MAKLCYTIFQQATVLYSIVPVYLIISWSLLRRKVSTVYSMTSIFIYLCNMLISRSYTVRKGLTDFAVLYLTDDAIAKLNICDLKFRQHMKRVYRYRCNIDIQYTVATLTYTIATVTYTVTTLTYSKPLQHWHIPLHLRKPWQARFFLRRLVMGQWVIHMYMLTIISLILSYVLYIL